MCERLYIYPKDLMQLTGLSERTCRREYNLAKSAFNKTSWLTIREWCLYNNDDFEIVKKALFERTKTT